MSNTVLIGLDEAKAIYKDPQLIKERLEKAFGAGFHSDKITDRIKSFHDACEAVNIDTEWFDKVTAEDSPDEIAYKKLKIIVKALNEGWVPDWNNDDEYKWRPWFYLDKPGFRFCASVYDGSNSGSAGGSRLCFKSRELCDYAAKQFIDLYRDSFN